MTPIEDQLGAELHRLTDSLTPSSDPADDLRRGRRRRARTRLAVGCGALAAVASASAVVVLAPGGSEPAPVAKDPAPTSTPAPTPAPVTTPEGRTCVPMADPVRGEAPVYNRTVKGYRQILAERLDPQGAHLDRWEVTRSVQSSGSQLGCPEGSVSMTGLGTKVGWRVAGESGQGVVQVFVVAPGGWPDSSVVAEYDDWQDRPVALPGVASAEVSVHEGGTAVVVHRADGFTVEIDANDLFGNNSLTPVSSLDLTVDQLLAAAADPRFTLP